MSSGLEKKQNPWAGGGEAESALGKHEATEIRLRSRLEQRRNRRAERFTQLSVEEAQAQSTTDDQETVRDAFCRSVLESTGTIEEKFRLINGCLDRSSRPSGKKETSLTECASPTGTIRSLPAFTPADIMREAEELMRIFPELIFYFNENKKEGTFSYAASLKEG